MYTCQICEKVQFESTKSLGHHLRSHKIRPKEYYDRYMKADGEGLCKHCGDETKFEKMSEGYRIYCSRSCMQEHKIGTHHTAEAKAKISASSRGHKKPAGFGENVAERNRGREVSGETRERLREARTGHTVSAVTRERMSESQRAGWDKLSPEERERLLSGLSKSRGFAGHSHSEESKVKTSAALAKTNDDPEVKTRRSSAQAGKTHSEETKAKIGDVHRGKEVSADTRAKQSDAHTGTIPSEETRQKMSESAKGNTSGKANAGVSKSPEHVEKVAATHRGRKREGQALENIQAHLAKTNSGFGHLLREGKPNKLEARFDEMTPEDVIFCSGRFWRSDGTGNMSPDFLVMDQKKVIEIYGDYWHKDDDPKDRIARWLAVGYDCIIFWEHEVNNDPQAVLSRLEGFCEEAVIA